jgi:DNA invertase Pin-like site-specific DNA recombinase
MTKRAALYLRVSTDRQTVENQQRELEAVAARMGWQIVEIYTDAGISGAKGRDERPAFDRICKDATRRKFDIVMTWSVDRLGRSLLDLISFLKELHAVGVDLYLDKQGINTTTPTGKAMFGMMGIFAEFEREMIRDRVNSGLARAKANGVKLGRPGIGADIESKVRDLKAAGHSIRKIAELAKVSVGKAHAILKAAA